jgi:hypothetical protein
LGFLTVLGDGSREPPPLFIQPPFQERAMGRDEQGLRARGACPGRQRPFEGQAQRRPERNAAKEDFGAVLPCLLCSPLLSSPQFISPGCSGEAGLNPFCSGKKNFFGIIHFYGAIRAGSDSHLCPSNSLAAYRVRDANLRFQRPWSRFAFPPLNPSKSPITLLTGHCGVSPPPIIPPENANIIPPDWTYGFGF